MQTTRENAFKCIMNCSTECRTTRTSATTKVRRIGKAGFRKRLLTMEFTRPENNVLNLRDRLRFPCWRWNWVTIVVRVTFIYKIRSHFSRRTDDNVSAMYSG